MPRAKTRPADARPVRLELTPEENDLVERAAQATGERYRSVFARRVVVEAARAALAESHQTAAGRVSTPNSSA
jgi:uncharacterized protein (DUF1778 family)